ncbi:N5-carboxyaminoimidazole ribonucleotide mutase [bioreactor metagenome]|uniref:N5-carboxyaminoimidazole ribonucleotide mutase n=1 Tax=bioreactor metagenome TaxID=1076179 RepID=A0A644ZR67_9ZZZZ
MDKQVAIIMGSKSDLPLLEGAFKVLEDFGIGYEAHVMSAHRTPERAMRFAAGAREAGLKVIICAAGMAAHLAGVMAAHTVLPVLGIPVASEPFNGLDALLATVQMPPGIPVGTVTAGKAGAKNAALLAVAILALADAELQNKLQDFRAKQTAQVEAMDAELQREIAQRG